MKKVLSILLFVVLLCSCTKTEYITIPEYHTDTTYITKHQRDSIYLHDSISVKEKGDTIQIEKWHTKYIEREVHDTCYQSKVDSVPKPYPVIKKVPADLSWWQTTRLYIADILLWVLLIGGILWIIKKRYF